VVGVAPLRSIGGAEEWLATGEAPDGARIPGPDGLLRVPVIGLVWETPCAWEFTTRVDPGAAPNWCATCGLL
jgi:hypothetical protein